MVLLPKLRIAWRPPEEAVIIFGGIEAVKCPSDHVGVLDRRRRHPRVCSLAGCGPLSWRWQSLCEGRSSCRAVENFSGWGLSCCTLTPLSCRIACHHCIYVAQLGLLNPDVGIDGEILWKFATRALDRLLRGVRPACVVTRGLTVES